jgi:hypothetical protein
MFMANPWSQFLAFIPLPHFGSTSFVFLDARVPLQ